MALDRPWASLMADSTEEIRLVEFVKIGLPVNLSMEKTVKRVPVSLILIFREKSC